MRKIWWCSTCGYEVDSRGRCHRCKERLVASPLPELEVGAEEDEVGYRLDDWADEARARLIAALIDASIRHRFEAEELVVDAGDEQAADEVLDVVAGSGPDEVSGLDDAGDDPGLAPASDEGAARPDQALAAEVAQLHRAAGRLSRDPTDMEADGEVAEASTVVFSVESIQGVAPDTWAAVGRVTRRLMGALGAEDAMEEEIRTQATILARLLDPVVAAAAATLADRERALTDLQRQASPSAGLRNGAAGNEPPAQGSDPGKPADAGDPATTDDPVGADGPAATGDPAASGALGGQSVTAPPPPTAPSPPTQPPPPTLPPPVTSPVPPAPPTPEASPAASKAAPSPAEGSADPEGHQQDPSSPGVGTRGPRSETVYELGEWLPEQRAELAMVLDDKAIPHSWDGAHLVVSSDREEAVETALDGLEESDELDADEESRYRTLEELFTATDRLVSAPADKARRAQVMRAVTDADGSTPVGLDDAQWWQIRQRARTLADAIEHQAQTDVMVGEAKVLRDLLHGLM